MVEIPRPIFIKVFVKGKWSLLTELEEFGFIVYPIYLSREPVNPEDFDRYVGEAEGWVLIQASDLAWGIECFKTLKELIARIKEILREADYEYEIIKALDNPKIVLL